jgi:hypothetical protein
MSLVAVHSFESFDILFFWTFTRAGLLFSGSFLCVHCTLYIM